MSRSTAAARNLSLTEELEKLEQSITLTLQEIDHNFSKSHRIVTTSIIPLVEQYGDHSRAIWEASKFWKQFFEASANVSLSGYEETNNDADTTAPEESTTMRDDTEVEQTPKRDEDMAGQDESILPAGEDESMLDGEDLAGSTPRRPVGGTQAIYSPYATTNKAMKDEEEEGEDTTVLGDDSTVLFAQRTAQLPDLSLTPQAMLDRRSSPKDQSAQGGKDPLLHRVLDKNYRIQSTPHRRVTPLKGKGKEKVSAIPSWQDDSLMSSPEIAAPQLRSEAFMSPYKSGARQRQPPQGPRTPGVSVQTPASGRKTRDVLGGKPDDKVEIDWDIGEEVDDDDVDLYAGMSPPKTIQFALPPSKLLQTPAREASRRIVDDILQDAGADSSEYSPTVVKMNERILDDSF